MDDSLGDLVAARLADFEREAVISRIWARDYTVWSEDPTELSNRLGWLDIAERMAPEAERLEAFAAEAAGEGFRHTLLLGMGGSSLGPEVLSHTLGAADGRVTVSVLDSTDPDQIVDAIARADLAQTLIVVSSKSGGTIETLSQMEYFWDRLKNPRQFVAITDPGSKLDQVAGERGYRATFHGDPEVGGRFSVLSHFGLVPAALLGCSVEQLLDDAVRMAEDCRDPYGPGAWLGAALGEAALAGRDKLTLLVPESLDSFGTWVEQLIAESTGKDGKGILPIEGESPGPIESYGSDRAFVCYEESHFTQELERAGHPVVKLEARGLGAEFFRWEFATAVAGRILGVQPFDQPNVQEAKDAAGTVLSGQSSAAVPVTLEQALGQVQRGGYIAVTAFVPRNHENQDRLEALRNRLRKFGVAVTTGFGPRYLHSTGQYHKGGPANGVFIQVVHQPQHEVPIPGQPYGFAELERAQADGDLDSLTRRGRPVARIQLSEVDQVMA